MKVSKNDITLRVNQLFVVSGSKTIVKSAYTVLVYYLYVYGKLSNIIYAYLYGYNLRHRYVLI